MVKVSAKPLHLFQTLMSYLEAQHIVVPGYSVLQDIVSRALAAERQRMTTLIDRALDSVTRATGHRLPQGVAVDILIDISGF